MIHIEMIAYHTCKNQGGKKFISENTPFLSRECGQWLTQGYYFWTDSIYWAKKWMKGKGIISKFMIIIPRERLLDLVGNVKQQQEFLENFEKTANRLRANAIRNNKVPEELTVSRYIYLMRMMEDERIFPYWAIKAKDNISLGSKPFIKGRNEMINFIERQQLCVFADHKKKCVFLMECDVK